MHVCMYLDQSVHGQQLTADGTPQLAATVCLAHMYCGAQHGLHEAHCGSVFRRSDAVVTVGPGQGSRAWAGPQIPPTDSRAAGWGPCSVAARDTCRRPEVSHRDPAVPICTRREDRKLPRHEVSVPLGVRSEGQHASTSSPWSCHADVPFHNKDPRLGLRTRRPHAPSSPMRNGQSPAGDRCPRLCLQRVLFRASRTCEPGEQGGSF